MFDSRHESYQENLDTAQKIGDVVGKGGEMKLQIDKHNKIIESITQNINVKGKKQFSAPPAKTNSIYKMTVVMSPASLVF
ncbi:iron-dicitrate transporter substrate-binding subunit [Aggregatibacter aphrophilus]|uniref:Iron-dicitrate transporter substrate-binding subunit n=1 Tax=Aggregatibacter aphrophilus TaxID=732 RepID=A0A336NCB0_AGGAP|nr:iron-dicitrate transporter substrate-binding subunit [Aggregatibacter aphrophilus]